MYEKHKTIFYKDNTFGFTSIDVNEKTVISKGLTPNEVYKMELDLRREEEDLRKYDRVFETTSKVLARYEDEGVIIKEHRIEVKEDWTHTKL